MIRIFLSVALLGFLLSGCGLKGPLYEPEQQTTLINSSTNNWIA